MKNIYLTLMMALLSITTQAQVQNCGTTPDAEHLESLAEKVEILKQRSFKGRTLDHKVPVKVHIVRKSNQETTIDLNKVVREFDKLNDIFSGAGLEFYMSNQADYIDSDELYNFSQNEETKLAASRDEDNVINIYFVGTITNNNGDNICGYTYYPKTNKDRIFIANGCLDNSTTLAHEVGHYFALIHTHGISGISPEAVNGENCSTAGDLLCDTPADPNLQGKVNQECEYTGDATDANGTPYQPSTENIMSYSPSYCRGNFSQEQLDVMTLTYEENRNYLQITDGYQPVADIVASSNVKEKTFESLKVKIYPNPAGKRVGVKILNEFEGDYRIVAFNTLGKVVKQTPVRTYHTGSIVEMDLSNNGSGIYLISVIAQNERVTKKIMLN